MDKPAGILIKTTCVDYPGMVAASFFFRGCNLYCPYCYNSILVNSDLFSATEEELSSINELFSHLEKRQGVLQGFVISGGEALLSPYLEPVILKAKELGYKVKLDTNGLLPERLEKLIFTSKLKPDFIAMDLKTSPDRYSRELCRAASPVYNDDAFFINALSRSAELISSLPPECREFRTVLVPGLTGKDDIKKIAEILPEDASWQFAQFLNKNCLEPSFNSRLPYSDSEAAELVSFAKNLIKGAELR